MTLTQEEKELYALFVNNVYDGALNASANDITLEVAQIVDQMLNAISKCSEGMAVADAMFRVFYGSPALSFVDILKKVGKTVGRVLTSWLTMVRTDRRYRVCVNATALNWRSTLQMALMGI